MTVAKRWRGKNGRLKISFLFRRDGSPSRPLRRILNYNRDANRSVDITDIYLQMMPYYVTYNNGEDDEEIYPSSEWMSAYIKGTWSIWSFQRDDPTQEKYGMFYCFDREQDAVIFKLCWHK